MDIKTIREAICRNRGGHKTTTDAQLRVIWGLLTPETQESYLQSVKPKPKETRKEKGMENAVSDAS